MTGCDLCANMKPWDVQVETVKVIFEEFYEQVGRKIWPLRKKCPIVTDPLCAITTQVQSLNRILVQGC